MKFFADQDVYAVTVRYLRVLGHDVLTAAECGAAIKIMPIDRIAQELTAQFPAPQITGN